ncbi:MAG: hypothetical protein V2I34_03655 [Bacteroidales bacterium]|nr:hypothetical protein [Bacteroidales bacterium]
MIKHLCICLIIMLGFSKAGLSQDYFRVKADFSVKISNSNGTKSLTRGTVYYDKNIKELIYAITFPREEIWVSKDTSIYKYSGDTLMQRVTIPAINEFTVFHLSLNSGLNDYGLKKSNYNMSKVEKKGDLVLSYWKIPEQLNYIMDHVVVAKKDMRLESVVMVGEEQQILSKQFFRNYIKIGAFEFPQQIVQILYDSTGGENYQVTDFSNIKVNDMSDSQSYRFKM